MRDLDQQEQVVLEMLAEVWNQFLQLPAVHEWERVEFMHIIHQAQVMVMSRPAMEQAGARHGDTEGQGDDPARREALLKKRRALRSLRRGQVEGEEEADEVKERLARSMYRGLTGRQVVVTQAVGQPIPKEWSTTVET